MSYAGLRTQKRKENQELIHYINVTTLIAMKTVFKSTRLGVSRIQRVKLMCKQIITILLGYKSFLMLNSAEHEISTAHKDLNADKYRLFLLSYSQMLYFSC